MVDSHIQEKTEAIFPEVIGLVITHDGSKTNVCPINYQAVSTIYEQPLTVTIGLSNTNYTLETLTRSGEFVYAYPSQFQLKDTLYCGTLSGRTLDKLAQTKFTFSSPISGTTPLLEGAVLNYECRVVHTYNARQFTIVIGEIKHMHQSDARDVQKIYSLGEQKYGIISDEEVLQIGR